MQRFCSSLKSDLDNNYVNEISIGSNKGKVVIIDAVNRLYKLIIGSIGLSANIDNLHIEKSFTDCVGIIKFGMLPIYVFDGNSPASKYETVNERITSMEKSKQKCENMIDKTSQEFKKESKKCYSLFSRKNPGEMSKIEECKYVFELMGIVIVNAINEADPQCAAIAAHHNDIMNDIMIGVMSEDFDMLLYNAPALLKDFSFKKKTASKMNKEKILENLLKEANTIRTKNQLTELTEFTHENFVNFSVLIDSDYSFEHKHCKITKIPPQQLFEIYTIAGFDKITFVNNLEKITRISPDFLKIWNMTANVYLSPALVDPSTIKCTLTGIREEELLKFLEEKKINIDFVKEELLKVKQNYNVLKNIHNDKKNINQFKEYIGYQFNFHTRKWQDKQKLNDKHKNNINTENTEITDNFDKHDKFDNQKCQKNISDKCRLQIQSRHKAMILKNDDSLNSFFTARMQP
ncbi:hypothetical protein BMW23_0880 [Bodo saltans virus]|jgi:5'-3' exonuclease|uniref:XPG-I domain-containing protein n=1 Tax=Bodo saltans virus TaxID=2024608 RepID=A0A2H4UVR0_9VIRU|nr:hypothetical protein QJ851_gp0862 [Bodo saltans virus]ATZ80925.1 hypothetical protein BMW23_0880 [Bodo saltans virus]